MASGSDDEPHVEHPYAEAHAPETESTISRDHDQVETFKNFIDTQVKILTLKKECVITLALTRKAYREEIESRTDLSAEEKEQLCRDLDRVSMDLQQWVLRK